MARPSLGSCQDDQDASHIYPRFFRFGQPPGTDNYGTRLSSASTWTSRSPAQSTTTGWTTSAIRSFASSRTSRIRRIPEMTNYANWFAYYRTRLQAVKTVTSITFKELDSKYRVGFHTLFQIDTILPTFLNIADFDAGVQKPAWYAKLFGVSRARSARRHRPSTRWCASASTSSRFAPAADRLVRSDRSVLPEELSSVVHRRLYEPAGQRPIPLRRPGYTMPNYPECDTKPILGLVPGSDWPGPFRRTRIRDGTRVEFPVRLRDVLLGDGFAWLDGARRSSQRCPGHRQGPGVVAASELCRGVAGHVGQAPGRQSIGHRRYADERHPAMAEAVPTVFKPDNSGVDDLWHAALNGRGRFVNAQSIDE